MSVPDKSVSEQLAIDSTMPYISLALDPKVMEMHFQKLLFGQGGAGEDGRPQGCAPTGGFAGYQVSDCQIKHVKYRAGKKCLIGYRVELSQGSAGDVTRLDFSSRVFPHGESLARYRKAQRAPLVLPALGEAVMHLSELEMVIWAFPNDRKISGLPSLLETASRSNPQLEQMIEAHFGPAWQIIHSTDQLIHYVPEHTCTTRVQLQLQARDSGLVQAVNLFGKSYYNSDGAETWRLMHELWSLTAKKAAPLRIAQPVSYEAEHQILWQMGLPGETMLTFEGDKIRFEELVVEAAQAVATLHAAQLPCARTSQQSDWLHQLEAVGKLVETLQPHLAKRFRPLIERLMMQAARCQAGPVATLHGDLHWQNFLVDVTQPLGTRLSLIDLDNLSSGSPWQDLGSLFAGLIYRALLATEDADAADSAPVDELIEAFCQGYQAVAPWPIDRAAIQWYTAMALVNERIFRAISRLKPGRIALIEGLLSKAEALSVTRERIVASEVPLARATPVEFARFYDLDQMRPLLTEELSRLAGCDVQILHLGIGEVRHRIANQVERHHKSTLLITYELEIKKAFEAPTQPLTLYLKGFLHGRSQEKFDLLGPSRPSPELNHLLVRLPEFDAIAWTQANDPSLPELRGLLDPKQVVNLFPYALLPDGMDGPDGIRAVTVDVARYKPLDRCIIRYLIHTRSGESIALFNKCFKDERGEALFQRMQTLWQHSLLWEDAFAMAQPLHYSPLAQSLWMTEIPGVQLTHRGVQEMALPDLLSILTGAAKGLARLHQWSGDPGGEPVSSTGAELHTTADYLSAAKKKINSIQQQFPQINQYAEPLLQELNADSLLLPDLPRCPVHGAFRIKQLLVTLDGAGASRIGVVDFDGFALADPLADVADMVVDLLVTGEGMERSITLINHFCHEYAKQVPWPVASDHLRWHMQLQLIQRAYWARQKSGRSESIFARLVYLLDLASGRMIAQIAEVNASQEIENPTASLDNAPIQGTSMDKLTLFVSDEKVFG